MMVDWAVQSELPVLLLLTKADKLKRGAAQNILLKVRREVNELPEVRVQLFSALKNMGVDEVWPILTEWLSTDEPDSGDVVNPASGEG